MPYTKKKYTTKKKTNTYKPKRKYYKKTQTSNRINKSLVPIGKGFPKRMLFTHKYADNFTLTSTTGVMNKYYFICNGMWDPNKTGTGHQPAYFDTMHSLYNHWTVIGSKITIKCCFATETDLPAYVALLQDDDGVLSSNDMQNLSETSSGKVKLVGAKNPGVITLTNRWSAKKTFGGSVLANDELKGDSSQNPAETSSWVIALQAANVISTVSMYVHVNIEYIAVWSELKELASS